MIQQSYFWVHIQKYQSILKEINPGYSLEGLMLKLKLQYFGHMMWAGDSLKKTLMQQKIEGRRRKGRQSMRWLAWTCQIHKPVSFSLFLQPVCWVLSLPHQQSLDWDAPFVNCSVQLLLSILFSQGLNLTWRKGRGFLCSPTGISVAGLHHWWAGNSKHLGGAKSITAGQEYCRACISLCMHLLFSQQVVILSLFFCRKKIEHVITSFSHLPSYSGIWQSWIGYSWTVELKTSQTIPPSKTTKDYFATEGPRFLNAFQSEATNACMRSDAIGCWLRAMWRTSSPSGQPPNPAVRASHLQSSSSWNDTGSADVTGLM